MHLLFSLDRGRELSRIINNAILNSCLFCLLLSAPLDCVVSLTTHPTDSTDLCLTGIVSTGPFIPYRVHFSIQQREKGAEQERKSLLYVYWYNSSVPLETLLIDKHKTIY